MDLARVVHLKPTLATPEMTVLEAASLMVSGQVGAIVICSSDRKLQGMFTEADNLQRVTMVERNPRTTTLAEVMSAPVVSARADTKIDEALAMMVRNRFSCLPVVDVENSVIGVVSMRDLLMRRISEKETALQTLEAFASAGGPG